MFYRRALRPLLFTQDAETAHERTLRALATMSGLNLPTGRRPYTDPRLATEIAGISFPNPVGLAAGCDKDGRAILVWPRLGFGFVEAGTVTAQPQLGNPRPRLFREPELGAIVNRMGFNGQGSEVVARRLQRLRRTIPRLPAPLGINIGKTKLVSGDEATLDDYRTSFRRLWRLADYIAVNVSSPNTPGLRQWQQHDKLAYLLAALMEESRALAARHDTRPVPIFVKISPDMPDADIDAVADVAGEQGLAGIIATNTTIAREGTLAHVEEQGGLSGRPLRQRATEVIRRLYQRTQGAIPLIGVGGIFTPEDAYERIRAGASLIQIYTSLIYEGPFLPRRINEGLIQLLERDGIANIAQAVGTQA